MTVLGSLVRNGVVVRAVLLAVVSTGAVAVGRPLVVPFAVAGYAVWNATALTLAAARAATSTRAAAHPAPATGAHLAGVRRDGGAGATVAR